MRRLSNPRSSKRASSMTWTASSMAVGGVDDEGVIVDAVVVPVADGGVVLVDGAGVVLVPELAVEPGVVEPVVAVDDGGGVVDDGDVADGLAELVVLGVVADGVVPGVFVSGVVDAVPQISSLDSLSVFVAASGFVALGAVVAGVEVVVEGVALGVVAAGVGVVVAVAAGFVPAFDSCSRSSFSLFCRSAISESLSVSWRSVLLLMSSSSLTRDLSSDGLLLAAGERFLGARELGFELARSPPCCRRRCPDDRPSRRCPCRLSAGRARDVHCPSSASSDAVDSRRLRRRRLRRRRVGAFGSGFAPVSAMSVGFVAAPPRQSSICECTWAAASLAEPTALI